MKAERDGYYPTTELRWIRGHQGQILQQLWRSYFFEDEKAEWREIPVFDTRLGEYL